MSHIFGSVGRGGANNAEDVAWVQKCLIRHSDWIDQPGLISTTGVFDPPTAQGIKDFQLGAAALLRADGMVRPIGFTRKQLERTLIPHPRHAVFSSCWFRGNGALTQSDYQEAAASLQCEVAAIRAVAQTETKSSPWDEFGRPTILFEKQIFGSFSRHIYDLTHPDISGKHGYKDKSSSPEEDRHGLLSLQYKRLMRAAVLDETAALQSASWGTFQILGENFRQCGFLSVDDFVTAMLENQKRHLDIFVKFISKNNDLRVALQKRDWASFATIYNGTVNGKIRDDYDIRISEAYSEMQPARPERRAHEEAGTR